MNQSRMQSMIDGLTGTAGKVFEAVPIRERWTVGQVIAELARQGSPYDHAKVSGCLRSLREQGLVREFDGGLYQRQETRPRLTVASTTEKPAATDSGTHSTKQAHMDPMSNLAEIAATLREQAAQLNARADALDAVAIEVAEAMEKSSEDTARLRQLRSLLRDA